MLKWFFRGFAIGVGWGIAQIVLQILAILAVIYLACH